MEDTQVRDMTWSDTLTKSTDLNIDIKKFLSIVERSNKCRIESLIRLRNQVRNLLLITQLWQATERITLR